MDFRFRHDGGFGERDFSPLLECGAAFVCKFQHAEFLRGLAEKAEPDEFAANRRPFGTAVFLADAVSRKLRVIPLADFFRVRAGEDFDNVIQADAKTVFLADAIDAGENFCAASVPSNVARGERQLSQAPQLISVG